MNKRRVKAVVDTNVLVSGLIRGGGYPGKILEAVRSTRLVLCADRRMLDEYETVLRRQKFRPYFGEDEVNDLMQFFTQCAEIVRPDHLVDDLPDPGDCPFLEVALAGSVPLVTGNLKHFPESARQGAEVMDPKNFCMRFLRFSG